MCYTTPSKTLRSCHTMILREYFGNNRYTYMCSLVCNVLMCMFMCLCYRSKPPMQRVRRESDGIPTLHTLVLEHLTTDLQCYLWICMNLYLCHLNKLSEIILSGWRSSLAFSRKWWVVLEKRRRWMISQIGNGQSSINALFNAHFV